MRAIIIAATLGIIAAAIASALAAVHPLNQWLQWLPAPIGALVFCLACWTIRKTEEQP